LDISYPGPLSYLELETECNGYAKNKKASKGIRNPLEAGWYLLESSFHGFLQKVKGWG
jgi:hypothetical protein